MLSFALTVKRITFQYIILALFHCEKMVLTNCSFSSGQRLFVSVTMNESKICGTNARLSSRTWTVLENEH